MGRKPDHFRSPLVDHFRAHGYRLRFGETTVALASEFGFCYGVDRAVERALNTRRRFPDRRIWITGEIIHNARVNRKLREMGVLFLPENDPEPGRRYASLRPEDVVLIPAFGVPAPDLTHLRSAGCELIDTTCGSVLNVWKRVRQYARDGFTSVIHGKAEHEETAATCSQVREESSTGRFLVIRNFGEAERIASMIETGSTAGFHPRFDRSSSPGFEPERDLERIGLANQTTMLETESREIEKTLRRAIAHRYGEEELPNRFRAFATICSATEDRQRAVRDLIRDGVDMVLIVGGYNSSNTGHLVKIASHDTPAYHIESAECIRDAESIVAKELGGEARVTRDWLPQGPVVIGVTGGASTPDSLVGGVIARVLRLRGETPPAEPSAGGE